MASNLLIIPPNAALSALQAIDYKCPKQQAQGRALSATTRDSLRAPVNHHSSGLCTQSVMGSSNSGDLWLTAFQFCLQGSHLRRSAALLQSRCSISSSPWPTSPAMPVGEERRGDWHALLPVDSVAPWHAALLFLRGPNDLLSNVHYSFIGVPFHTCKIVVCKIQNTLPLENWDLCPLHSLGLSHISYGLQTMNNSLWAIWPGTLTPFQPPGASQPSSHQSWTQWGCFSPLQTEEHPWKRKGKSELGLLSRSL